MLTGSTNFTPTGVSSNLNLVVEVNWKRVAANFAEEFEEMWEGTFGLLRERRDRGTNRDGTPPEHVVRDVPVKILFAPDHGPEMEIMNQMMKATTRVDFAIFTFARSSGIDDTMKVLARSGIKVRGIIDGSNNDQEWAASHGLLEGSDPNIELYEAKRVDGLNKLHHKLLVIDGKTTIVGSYNFTGPANRLNDENILVVGDYDAVGDGEVPGEVLARASLAEIDRMIDRFGEPMRAPDAAGPTEASRTSRQRAARTP